MRALIVVAVLASAASAEPCADPAACAKVCSARDVEACTIAAEAYFDGKRVPVDAKKSFALAKIACDAGDGHGCAQLGFHYQDGVGTDWAPAQAIAAYEKGCRAGTGVACYNLAGMYSGGHGVVVDMAKYEAYKKQARDKWQAACEGSAPRWCTNFAFIIEGEGDPKRARQIVQRACALGISIGCAQATRIGFELKVITSQAYIRELDAQCKAGEVSACGMEAAALRLGDAGIAKDEPRALELSRRACDAGDAPSCISLAADYAEGRLVTRDPAAARRYAEMACDRRVARACLAVARWLADDRDLPGALGAARRACQMGNGEACELVATAMVGAKDDAGALKWSRAACQMGRGLACRFLLERDLDLPIPASAKPQVYGEACTAGIKPACKHVGT